MQYKRIDFARPVAMPGLIKTQTRFDTTVDEVTVCRYEDVVVLERGNHRVEVPWAQVAWAEAAPGNNAPGYHVALSKSQEKRVAIQKQADPLDSEPEKAPKKSGRPRKTKKGTSRARRPRAKKD